MTVRTPNHPWDRVTAQFGPVADRYRACAIFSQGPDLEWIVQASALTGHESVLDVGTGAGHTALVLAGSARRVVCLDPTPEMLASARCLAEERGQTRVEFVVGAAEQLPFADGQFDLVSCRYAAHHFADLTAALREVCRVLRPGGRLVVVDNVAPSDPELERWINELERHRDPSHVHEFSLEEWATRLEDVGLTYTLLRRWPLPLEFQDWVGRSQTPEDEVRWLRTCLETASPAARHQFQIGFEPTLGFSLPAALFAADKRRSSG